MATFKKKNSLQKGKDVAAKVWNVYWGDDEAKAKRENKIHIGKIDKESLFSPKCGVMEPGRFRRNEKHAQVTKAKRSEFCQRCLRSPLNIKFINDFDFEKETLTIDPVFRRPEDFKVRSIIPVIVGNRNYNGSMNWSKKVHAATVYASNIKIACGANWAVYRRNEFKVVEKASFDDTCSNCGKHPEKYIAMLEKLGLAKPAAVIEKEAKANEKNHFIIGTRDGEISILQFTRAELLAYLKDNPDVVEKINNKIFILTGNWITPMVKYKQVVEEITL